jgi:hypothetical protein
MYESNQPSYLRPTCVYTGHPVGAGVNGYANNVRIEDILVSFNISILFVEIHLAART